MVTKGFPGIFGLYLLKRHSLAGDSKSAAEEATSIAGCQGFYATQERKVAHEGSNGIATVTFHGLKTESTSQTSPCSSRSLFREPAKAVWSHASPQKEQHNAP